MTICKIAGGLRPYLRIIAIAQISNDKWDEQVAPIGRDYFP